MKWPHKIDPKSQILFHFQIGFNMENVQHTPGPWRVDPYFATDIQDGVGGIEISRACVKEDGGQRSILPKNAPPIAQAKANARLIAAAPELLEALKGIQAEAIANEAGNPGYPSPWAAVLAAIAKATGQTPDGEK